MNNLELVEKLKKVATDHKTLYVMGCFGAPLTGANVTRYCTNHSYNKAADRTAMIKAAANQNPPVFGFDCVCLIKGILWGWNGSPSATYGGAKYAVNGVPDIGADQMITKCSGISTDFSKIEIGEAVWMTGHIGIYIGNGLAVECTPRWNNKVQITAVLNIGAKSGYDGRSWTKHGKLPYITYVAGQNTTSPVPTPTSGTSDPEKTIWTFLTGKGLSACAVAGIMGNLYAESGLRSDNLQNTYEKKLGMTDAQYTNAVDSGVYNNFVKDSAGYGLAQWTYWSRKQALLDSVKAAGASIGDLTAQLNFLWKEIQGYAKVMTVLKSAKTVREASDVVLCEYERPANMGEEVKVKRAGYGQTYYDKFAGKTPAPTTPQKSVDEIAKEVIAGKWGNGQIRKDKLTAAGYNYNTIQARVNALLK